MVILLSNIRYAFRTIRKELGLTAVIVMTLAIGIGANTAIFSIVNGLLLRSLPVREPDQIMVLAANQKGTILPTRYLSYPDLEDYRKQPDSFSGIFGYTRGLAGLSCDGRADQIMVSYVTGNYFSTLGVKPTVGTLFLPGEGEKIGEVAKVVLGYSYWQKRFFGDNGIVGKQVRVNGQDASIVGIVAMEFGGLDYLLEMDAYMPISNFSFQGTSSDNILKDRGSRRLSVLGRLKPGISPAQAEISLSIVAQRLAEQYPATNKDFSIRVIPEKLARPFSNNMASIAAGLFLILAALVLLLACMNVANILLVWATDHQREWAIRASLGAPRGLLISQFITKSIILALLGSIAGLILGAWISQTISSIQIEPNYPVRMDFSFDWRVFVYASAAAMLTAMAIGLLPALRASRNYANEILHDGGRSYSSGKVTHRMRNLLVIGQIAGSLMLLIVAGLFVRSLGQVQHINLGFDPDHLLNVVVDPQQIGYSQSRTVDFYRELEARVRTIPGVESTTIAFSVPMGVNNDASPVTIEKRPIIPGLQPPMVLFNSIAPSYFGTMRIPLLRGRVFSEFDNEAAPQVAIINQTMANQFWPNEDPIGKRFSVKSIGGVSMRVNVVGVVANSKYMSVTEEPLSYFYVPLAQNYTSMRALQIRTSVPPESLVNPVRREISDLVPELPISELRTMREGLEGAYGLFIFRQASIWAAAIGFIGLILALVGIYGIISYTVAQRTHEIGIRIALGSTKWNTMHLILWQGARLTIAGVLLGLFAAYAITNLMTTLLIGISPADPITFVVVTVLLVLTALCACIFPARRAVLLNPITALRHE